MNSIKYLKYFSKSKTNLIPIVKKIEVFSSITSLEKKIRSQVNNSGKLRNIDIDSDEIISKDPMESIIIALNVCKIKTIQHFFAEKKIYIYEKIEINSKSEFDFDRYLFPDKMTEDNKIRNINFSFVDILIKIKLKEIKEGVNQTFDTSNKINNNMISEIEIFSNRCPVYNVLKAGTNINKKIIIDI